jgi:hypothetical protein
MKAPPDTDLAEILAAAVKLIDPPQGTDGLCWATLETAISTVLWFHERTVNLPSPAEMKKDMASYLTALRAVRRRANAVAPLYWSKAFGDVQSQRNDRQICPSTLEQIAATAASPPSPNVERADRAPPPPYNFVEALDREIREVEDRAGFPVPPGAQPRDLTADMAARAARGLLEVRFIFPKDRDGKDLPAVKNPWRQDAPLTEGGVWPELSALIYEAVTDRANHDMMPACRQADELLLRLPYSSTRRPPRPKTRRSKSRRSAAARR